ncbi:josephin domain-containing protein [Rhodotorula paludigena]|uniref:josephin domain-containing protein n=1 Tax=Rhodotorula paludigena TaxID=86838 RepID=UPI003180CBD5
MADLAPHIYHETQEQGSMLCGQHALNNLLQSSIFTAPDLAEIARQLDALEQAQLDPGMRLQGDSPWEASQNYDDSGFFSVQVMEEALKLFGLRLIRWGSKEMASVHDSPENVEAFLLNHQLHWFSIRRFGTPERFYNLDSCIRTPQWVSSMYLGLTLREAEKQGYSIFAVVPAPESNISGLPSCRAADFALTLPAPRGTNGTSSAGAVHNPWSSAGNGHSLAAGPSGVGARQPFSSALNPRAGGFGSSTASSLSSSGASSAARKGKRPASDEDLVLGGGDEDDDDVVIQEDSGSVETESEKRRRRRRLERAAEPPAAAPGGMSEEEMMAAAIRESLKVSGGGDGRAGTEDQGGGTAGSSGDASAGTSQASMPSRAALSEEEEFQRAVQASLATVGGEQEEVSEDDAPQGDEDSPSMEELRRRRLARFGG